jgi:hypothetical protein
MGPLSRTGMRLSGNPVLAFHVGVPENPQWHAVSQLPLPQIDKWLTAIAQRRNVAAATLLNQFASRIVKPALGAFLVERRVPLSLPLVRWNGTLDGTAFSSPRVAVLPTDPDADFPDSVTVSGVPELHHNLAEYILAAMTPVVDTLREHTRLGRPLLWGAAVDALANGSVLTARLFDLPTTETWGHIEAIVDRLAARVPHIKARPRLFPVRWSGGESMYVVRGTCCLLYQDYRAGGGIPDPDGGAGYCGTCPLRMDTGREAQRRAILDRQAG